MFAIGPDVFNIVANGGAMAILAYIAVYLAPKWMNQMSLQNVELVKTFKEEQRYERDMCNQQFNEVMRVLQSGQENVLETLRILQKELALHQQFAEQSVDTIIKRKEKQS